MVTIAAIRDDGGESPMTGVESCPYRAFLFYSHRDTLWAKRLHRALEGLVSYRHLSCTP